MIKDGLLLDILLTENPLNNLKFSIEKIIVEQIKLSFQYFSDLLTKIPLLPNKLITKLISGK